VLDLLVVLTGLVVVFAMWTGYRRTRDALMPMMLFGPMLLYTYVYSPAMLQYHGDLERYFPDLVKLEPVLTVNLLASALFCVGCVSASRPVWATWRRKETPQEAALKGRSRAQLVKLAWLFGVMSLAAFWYMVQSGGGLVELFSRPKAFLSPPSGYVGEMPMLSYPAIVLLAVSLGGRRIGLRHVMLALLFSSPHLIMASLGGRRGSAFLVLCTLIVSWYLAKSRRPPLGVVISAVVIIGVLMLFLGSNRRNLYLGSDKDIDTQAFVDQVVIKEGDAGQEFIYSSGLMLTAQHFDRFYWGRRYFVTVFVRPIPRQLWPTKYEDLGLGWMVNQPGTAGFSDSDWLEGAGFWPLRGSASGFIADAFIEFWWFGVVICYLIGQLYGYCWMRSRRSGGLWTVVYVELLVLSVYLPAQSVEAWFYRALLLVVPTSLLWNHVVLPMERRALGRVSRWRLASASAILPRRRRSIVPRLSSFLP
jgi:oligosaccharide repeat unit polymerase